MTPDLNPPLKEPTRSRAEADHRISANGDHRADEASCAPASVSTIFHGVVAVKTYIVTFRRHTDRRPSKFIVVADSMREATDMAWEHGGTAFQEVFDRTTGQALEMKKGALRVL